MHCFRPFVGVCRARVLTRRLGSIGGHYIYSIRRTCYIPLAAQQSNKKDSPSESRYRQLFFNVDLSDFYFSYTYDMTHTLQRNLTFGPSDYDKRFVWNTFLTKQLRKAVGNRSPWVMPLIHGYFVQEVRIRATRCPLLSNNWMLDLQRVCASGHVFAISVIARRSRHFAGTRFLKRGVNEQGQVPL